MNKILSIATSVVLSFLSVSSIASDQTTKYSTLEKDAWIEYIHLAWIFPSRDKMGDILVSSTYIEDWHSDLSIVDNIILKTETAIDTALDLANRISLYSGHHELRTNYIKKLDESWLTSSADVNDILEGCIEEGKIWEGDELWENYIFINTILRQNPLHISQSRLSLQIEHNMRWAVCEHARLVLYFDMTGHNSYEIIEVQ